MKYKIINGNSAEVLKTYPDNYFDSVVTDPPYGINFLGKDWDSNVGEEEVYRQCFRVLKPGGYLLAFSAARTYHHLAMSVERSGFNIRDQIMWVYGSGFPKSQDIGKQIERAEGKRSSAKSGAKYSNYDSLGGVNTTTCRTCGKNNVVVGSMFKCDKDICDMRDRTKPADNEWSGWGNCLKPAHEPIVMAQKPFKGSLYKNVLENNVGGLNIDGCRVEYASEDDKNNIDHKVPTSAWSGHTLQQNSYVKNNFKKVETNNLGRFPANFIHDGSDEVLELFPDSNGSGGSVPTVKTTGYGKFGGGESEYTPNSRTTHNSGSGSAARFFYCAKVSRKERNIGCEDIEPAVCINDGRDKTCDNAFQRGASITNNNHPTVKPVQLMRYLIKLVTPPNGKVLDPFNGSGSTGMAAVELGHEYTGIELDPKYCEIARRRIEEWNRD